MILPICHVDFRRTLSLTYAANAEKVDLLPWYSQSWLGPLFTRRALCNEKIVTDRDKGIYDGMNTRPRFGTHAMEPTKGTVAGEVKS